MENSSPARLFATLVGGFLVIAGIVGFFYNASFDTGKNLQADDLLGILSVNGWHNLFHITTGLLGLACAGYAARQYSLGMGLIYLIVAIWGFASTNHGHGDLLDLLPVNGADNFLHLIIGLAGLGAGAATLQAGSAKTPGRRSRTAETEPTTPKASPESSSSKPKTAAGKRSAAARSKTGTSKSTTTKRTSTPKKAGTSDSSSRTPGTPSRRKRPPSSSS